MMIEKTNRPEVREVPAVSAPAGLYRRSQGPPSPQHGSLWWLWLMVLCVLGAAGYYFYQNPALRNWLGLSAPPAASAPHSVPVTAAFAEVRDFDVYIDGLLGNVVPLNTVNIKTRVDGQI